MSNQEQNSNVFVVIPVYNEATMIASVVDELLQYGYRIVLVDDGSSIRVSTLLGNRQVFLLEHLVNLGQGAALQTGIEFSLAHNAEAIVTFDADGQHLAEDIEVMKAALIHHKVDVVLGSRFLHPSQNTPNFKQWLLLIARWVNFLFTGLLLTDAHNGLRLMNRKAAEKINLRENRMAHATEILEQIKKNQLLFIEVPVQVRYTTYSLQKGQSAWNSFRILYDLILNKIFR